ncbi:MAG: hypothetical protein JXR12_01400 [Neptunomonas phycophila]|uniref:hypothetical protein n=1 Tax=Neptunomonas phycophila TaxID=1572645 RepID=UPI003B8DD201
MTGPLHLSGDPTLDDQASTKRYVDLQITTVRDDLTTLANNISNGMGQKVNKAGDEMSGFLRLHDDPTEPLHAAPKQYVDQQINNTAILKVGGTMTGPLQLSGDPTLESHAASKGYIDRKVSEINDTGLYLSLDGGVMNGPITLTEDPTDGRHAVTKDYVDNNTAGLSFKEAVRLTTTTNIDSLSGFPQIDGVQTNSGDRVLVKDQTDKIENGIYIVLATEWIRAPDATGTDMQAGTVVYATEGTEHSDSGWILATDGQITIDETPITFILFSATKADDQFVDIAGDNMTGSLFLVGDPLEDNEAANKGYIDRKVTEIGYKYSQDTPSNVWIIEHNRASTDVLVQVFDPNNEMVIPSRIKIEDPNTVRIEFGTSMVTGTTQLIFL